MITTDQEGRAGSGRLDGAYPVVIFDVGGVLIRTSPSEHYRMLARATGLEWTRIARRLRASGIEAAFERGWLSGIEFTDGLRRLLDRPRLLVADVARAWRPVLPEVDPLLAAAAERLAAEGRLVLAGNMNTYQWPMARARLCDAGVVARAYVSFRLGAAKPERRFFEAILRELPGAASDGAIYVDDQLRNIVAAQRLGLGGLVHVDAATTAGRLNFLAAGGGRMSPSVGRIGSTRTASNDGTSLVDGRAVSPPP